MSKVSVVIPTYNCGKYIVRALMSVLDQTYKVYEIIIVDDGSTDNTKQVLDGFLVSKGYLIEQKKDFTLYIPNNELSTKSQKLESGFIRYYYQQNKGPAAARNKGIREARGEYIAFLDADDQWNCEKLRLSLEFLEKYSFDWMCTAMLQVERDGSKFVKTFYEDKWVVNKYTHEINQLRKGLVFFSSFPIHIQTAVIKMSCFKKVGMFDESFRIGEDTDLFLRFEEYGLRGGFLDKPLTIYMYNSNGITKKEEVDGLGEFLRLGRKHFLILRNHDRTIRKTYGNFLWEIADRYHSSKKYLQCLKCVVLSIFYNPLYFRKVCRRLFIKHKI